MLKSCGACLGFDSHAIRDSGSNRDLGGASMSLGFSQSRDISVRIVHAGGKEELYQNAVPVSHLMEKNPGMCIVRPEVFKNPHESILRPEDCLFPGQKYYIIPSTTAQKLKRRHQQKVKQVKGAAEGVEDMSDASITGDVSGENLEESIFQAKEFHVTKPSKASRVQQQRRSKHSLRKGRNVRKPFVPPLPRTRLLRDSGWEPSLTSVQELSP